MTDKQNMEIDIDFYLDDQGYTALLETIIDACHYRAMRREMPPLWCSSEQWARREMTLRKALRDDE